MFPTIFIVLQLLVQCPDPIKNIAGIICLCTLRILEKCGLKNRIFRHMRKILAIIVSMHDNLKICKLQNNTHEKPKETAQAEVS